MTRRLTRPFALLRPSPEALLALAQDASGRHLTYAEVGLSTADPAPDPPHGWRRHERSAEVGAGPTVWHAAGRALRGWRVHGGVGITVAPPDAPLVVGTTVALAVTPGAGPLGALVATCRIVQVVQQEDCFGFAYGTLPLHPEQGEESFMVRRDAAGTVTVHVCAVSRPVIPVARLVPVVAHLASAAYVRGYVRSWQRQTLAGLAGSAG